MLFAKRLLIFFLILFSSSLFAVNYSLSNNEWRMISLPAQPPSGKNTVKKIFGDDINGTYGTHWVVYQYNADSNSYGNLKLNNVMEPGRGYWIIQKTGHPVTLAMPQGSVAIPDNYSIKLSSVVGSHTVQWTLSGTPFSSSVTLGHLFLKTDAGICSKVACNLDKANAGKLLHNQVWVFDGNKYVLINKQGLLNPWDGFWAASLESSFGHTLSLQKNNDFLLGDWYVKPGGRDSNDGRSINSAFATITHASEVAKAGDNIIIKAGEYSERVEIKSSGQRGKPISYIGEIGTVFNGANLVWWNWDGLFDIDNKEYINVSGIKVINSTWAGISVENSKHINIENNTTVDTKSSGIYVGNKSEYIGISKNIISGACKGGSQEALSVVASNNVTVSYNNVSNSGTGENNNGGEGIDIKAGSHHINVIGNVVHNNPKIGIYIDGWVEGLDIINIIGNEVYTIQAEGIVVVSEKGGPVNNVSIDNNNVHNNHNGITIGGRERIDREDPTPPVSEKTAMNNILILNNTVHNNLDGGIYNANQDAKNVVIRNNISKENGTVSNGQIEVSGTTASINEVSIDHNTILGHKPFLIWNIDTNTEISCSALSKCHSNIIR
jgi:hypothetical protein